MIDLHCHILPGVDDGPQELEESLAMARLAARDGIRTIVATPHLPPPAFADHPWIEEQVARLNAALQEEGLPVQVLAGAEVPAVPEVLEHLAELPRLGGGAYVLLEPPLMGFPNYLEEVVFGMQLAGVRVALAHPERTALIRVRPEVFERLAQRECVMQMNVESVTGRAGWATRRLALGLLRDSPQCVVATDAHDAVRRPPLLSPLARALRKKGGEARFRELTEEQPGGILGG